MAIIRFQPNIAETFHLRSLDGKPVESNYGGMQYMFSAEEGTFYVSDKVGGILMQQFRTLGVQPGEAVDITKTEAGRGPERRTQWIVAKSVTVGAPEPFTQERVEDNRRPHASSIAMPSSELEQQLAASIRLVEQRKQQTPAAAPAWAEYLVAQSNALIDAYSQVLTHASKYPNVRGEDVRSIFLSTFINVSKGANGRAA
jgi:hypothetical protein